MKIIKNTSAFDTRALRSIICKTHAHMQKIEGKPAPRWKGLSIKIQSRLHGTSGRAFYNGLGYIDDWDVFLSISPNTTIYEFAYLVYHELMHTYGYSHKQYSNIKNNEMKLIISDDGPLPEKIVLKQAAMPVWVKRYESALRRKESWEQKQSRAEKALKKVNAQIKYYERKYKP